MYTNLQIHFVHRHMQNTVVITEEGNRPQPRFLDCDIFVPWAELNCCYPTMTLFSRGLDKKKRRIVKKDDRVGTVKAFRAYDRPLETVSSFKYTRRLLTSTCKYRTEVITNI